SCLVRPLPRFILFPYTTLFRSTIYSCGLRISELCGLRVEDCNFEEQLVRVRGKGKKERLVPIGEHALRAIEQYWTTLEHTPNPEDRKSTRLNSSHVAISYAVFC